MSAELTVKDNIKSRADSADFEEVLVGHYESFYKKVYFLVFCFRIFLLILLLLLTKKVALLYNTDTLLESGFNSATAGVISSVIVAALSLILSFTLQGNPFRYITVRNFNKSVNDAEDLIVKLKLEQRFHTDSKLKGIVEDFYIEISNLTKAKYETAFQFYAYEFYVYAVVSCIIAGFFIYKIL